MRIRKVNSVDVKLHDFSGRLTAVMDGEKTLAEYVYSASGNPVVKKIGGNITSTYAYDELLNIKALKTETEKQTLADNHYFYDGNSNQIRKEGLEGTTGYVYDGRNRQWNNHKVYPWTWNHQFRQRGGENLLSLCIR